MLSATSFFDLEGSRFAELLTDTEHIWEALGALRAYVGDTVSPNVARARSSGPLVQRTVVLHQGEVLDQGFVVERGDVLDGGLRVRLDDGELLEGASVIEAGAILASDDIEIGRGVLVESGAYVRGPAIIGDRSEVRHGAYLRDHVLIGDSCLIGHATEVKASILLGKSLAAHFAYVGDSILGRVNVGAGTKLANLKVFPGTVTVRIDTMKLDTGLEKMGAIVGDGAELGCNSVTMPGTVLGSGVVVYPNTTVQGFHQGSSVLKGKVSDGRLL